MEKRSIGFSIVIVILIIIILVLISYILLGNGKNQEVVQENVISQNANITTNISNEKEDGQLYHLDFEKGKNTEEGVSYDIIKTLGIENIVLQLSLNQNKQVIVQVYEGDENKAVYTEDSFIQGINRSFEESEIMGGFSGTVDEIEIGRFGQDITSTVVLFLMNDGTVEYIGLKDLLQTEDLSSRGKIEGLENIIRLENIDAHEDNGGSWITTLAIDSNGEFYDIGNIINDF